MFHPPPPSSTPHLPAEFSYLWCRQLQKLHRRSIRQILQMVRLGKPRTQSLGTKQSDPSICDFGVVFRNPIRFIYIHRGYGGRVPKTHLKITNRGCLWGDQQSDSSICDFGVVFRGSIRFIYAHKGYGGGKSLKPTSK